MELLPNEMPGNDDALFRSFFEDTYPRVKAYLFTLLGTNMHVEDIAQEVYIKLWKNWLQIDKREPLDAYLFTMVRNMVASHFRKIQKEKLRLQALSMPGELQEQQPRNTAGNNNVVERLFHKDSVQLYEATLQRVSLVKQRCFRLHREYGLTHRQIAKKEGLSEKTIERYIREILQLLRASMHLHIVVCIIIFV
jgi:RNA polymerase sigma-70 factor (ECF subfamily)